MPRFLTIPLLVTLAFNLPYADNKQAAQEKPTKAGEALLALKSEFDAAEKKFFGERDELAKMLLVAKDDGERKSLEIKLDEWRKRLLTERPMTRFGPRFIAFAENNAKDPAGINALELVLRDESRFGSGPYIWSGPLWEKAVAVMRKQYVGIPEVKRLLRMLAASGDEASEKFVRAVMEKNPDRVTQALAAQALASAHEHFADVASQLKNHKEVRKETELKLGKESVDKVIAHGEKAQSDLKELETRIKEKYADIIPCVGKEAPEVICQDVDGGKVKLSDLKGKVVVLDIWATWCVPCKAMIPHQREIVAKLKDNPFALVSISIDADKETLKRFLDKEPMPWTHWWNGKEGGIVEDWTVMQVPTIYVLDAQGVIRHRELNDDLPKVEAIVIALLKEMEMKK